MTEQYEPGRVAEIAREYHKIMLQAVELYKSHWSEEDPVLKEYFRSLFFEEDLPKYKEKVPEEVRRFLGKRLEPILRELE